ncbi:hypothetical protein KUCAC02_007045, partial [Chaenocephalus aceratus]
CRMQLTCSSSPTAVRTWPAYGSSARVTRVNPERKGSTEEVGPRCPFVVAEAVRQCCVWFYSMDSVQGRRVDSSLLSTASKFEEAELLRRFELVYCQGFQLWEKSSINSSMVCVCLTTLTLFRCSQVTSLLFSVVVEL